MKLAKRIFVLFFLVGFWCTQAQPSTLSIETIFGSRTYSGDRFGPARWMVSGDSYTTVEWTDEGQIIVLCDARTGNKTTLVQASQLIPEGQTEPLALHNYEWSPDGNKLLVYTNSKRVWRQNTKGDYWVLDLKTNKLEQLGASFEPSTLMFAKFSPDNKQVGYVMKHNLFVENIATHQITQLTFDGSETIINGTFDWVYEEEFGLRDGFRWSPDGQQIAYWQLDASGVRDFYMINNTDSLYSFIIPVQYPKTGTTNSSSKVGVVAAKGGETTWFPLSDDLRNNYVARMEWAANPQELMIQHINRKQNRNEVTFINPKTKNVKVLFTEEETAWLDTVDDVKWMENDQVFTWVSERSGWKHVYKVNRNTGAFTDLVQGDYDVVSVEYIDVTGGWLYFIASPDNPTQRYLYRVPMSGKGQAERLTPVSQPGWHSYQISPNAKWAIHTYANFNTPPTISLVSLPNHEVVRILVDNKTLKEKVAALQLPPAEFFKVDIGEVELDGYLLKPSHFDPNKKYPVLFHVYGEPWGQTATDNWKGSQGLWHRMIAEKGYLVISVDNRGTPSPRGRDWRKIVYGSIGVLASADQAAAVKEIGKWGFVDASKIAIWGWSGGGSMSLNAIFRYPKQYHTAMSVAPVPDQTLYDTIYQERYMGTPQDNPEGYYNGSPMNFAHQLEGNLLVVHGTGDDNVHYQGTERLINKLIEYNKPFTMMAYPNRSHGIFEGKNTTIHLYHLLTRYLTEKMPPNHSVED